LHHDQVTAREAYAGPGMDTRQWITHGIVEPDTEDAHSVLFMDSDGNPLPNGILVMVKLVSTGIVVPCRVTSHAAGEGEAEYSPFGPGDEVLVAVADGDERSGCYILGKMSNGPDVFPQTVAGQDVTQNSISFKRIQTPYILETASSLQFRQASTSASWSIDPTGNIIFSDGEGNNLVLNQSALILQESTGSALLQIDPEKLTIALQSNATALHLDDANGSSFISSNTLQIVTSGGGYALGHAITLEQAINLITNMVIALGTVAVCAPGSSFVILPPTALTVIPAAIAASIAPLTEVPIAGPIAGAISTALAGSVPDPSGTLAGIGRPGLLF
jgi:hypothetical protein